MTRRRAAPSLLRLSEGAPSSHLFSCLFEKKQESFPVLVRCPDLCNSQREPGTRPFLVGDGTRYLSHHQCLPESALAETVAKHLSWGLNPRRSNAARLINCLENGL